MREKDLDFIRNGVKLRRVPLVSNQFVTVDVGAIVGYCHYKLHKGYLTVNLMNSHDCLGKNCSFFEKFKEYPYWIRAANRETEKRRQKEAERRKKEQQERYRSEYKKQLLEVAEAAQKIAKDYNFPIIITRVAPSVSGKSEEYVINYVSSLPFDDSKSYTILTKELGYIYYGIFFIRRLRMPDGTFATIEDWEKRIALTGKPSRSFY